MQLQPSTLTSYFGATYMSLYNSTYTLDTYLGLAKKIFYSGLNLNFALFLTQLGSSLLFGLLYRCIFPTELEQQIECNI